MNINRRYSDKFVEEPSELVKKLASNLSSDNTDMEKRKPVNAVEEGKFVFNQVWQRIQEDVGGKDKIWLPSEIIWLMGSPGSGKGTTAPAICKARGITNSPIVISNLLKDENTKTLIDRGEMVNDKFVFELLIRELLKRDTRSGVLVDGFPRTEVQVECLKLLYDKMHELKTEFAKTSLREHFRRPVFRLTVLYVDETESVRRQMKRGQQIREHNELVKTTGQGELLMERITDFDEKLTRARYQVFQQHFGSIARLKKLFPFHLINAVGSIDEVVRKIWQEFEYQSSLELDQDTFDSIHHIPIASKIGIHARQELVRRLEHYQLSDAETLTRCVDLIETVFLPAIQRHAISGSANIRVEMFKDEKDIDVVMDILSERGYRVSAECRVFHIPLRLDSNTMEIVCDRHHVWIFAVKFPRYQIRGAFGADESNNMFKPTPVQ